jgi:hypothetical protein
LDTALEYKEHFIRKPLQRCEIIGESHNETWMHFQNKQDPNMCISHRMCIEPFGDHDENLSKMVSNIHIGFIIAFNLNIIKDPEELLTLQGITIFPEEFVSENFYDYDIVSHLRHLYTLDY